MRPVLAGETVADKLGTIRQSLREIGYDPHAYLVDDGNDDDGGALDDYVEEEKGDRWDCETILSTCSEARVDSVFMSVLRCFYSDV